MDVRKADLIEQLVEEHGYTKAAATSIVTDFTDIIMSNLRKGNSISLRNFGCFDILERKARTCPNPQTGELVKVPAHWIPRFYPSNRMRMVVKEWEDDTKRGIK